MKNITVSLPNDLYRRARMKAAERNTSVSALVRDFLASLGQEESEFQRRKRLQDAVLTSIKTFRVGERLSRDEAHSRRALR